MSVPLLEQVGELSPNSIAFARTIGHASVDGRLAEEVQKAMVRNPEAWARVRAAVQTRLDELGGAGEATGLFMLAADAAATSYSMLAKLTPDERRQLRRLWDDLRAQ